ncbi:polyphosphate kinase 1 [Marinilabiliaceae bacterium JC017]|nr:polyphosphate kinase 1 [Marinilabiliaceae bacterium JC017]
MALKNYRSKEISWMSFNERLLQEANKNHVPLIERIKFLGIYSNNLDEFFRVRVAILKRLALLDRETEFEGGRPEDILKEIHKLVLRQGRQFAKIYEKIIKDLGKKNIFIINENQLDEGQGEYIADFFEQKVRPKLAPVILSRTRPLPDLKDDAIYLAVYLKSYNKPKPTYVLIELPTDLIDRFVLLPSKDDRKYIIILDDVVRYELKDIFYMFDFDEISAYTFKLTRDAELELDDDVSENYVNKIALSLEKRKEAHPVRFVYDKDFPKDFLDILLKKLNFTKLDAVIRGGRYHNFKDFVNFPKLGSKKMMYEELPPIPHRDIPKSQAIFPVLKEKDILLHIPYHSFQHFVDFLREASIDPDVREIRVTVYRVAQHSNVMNALINAARNGKKVTAVLELQARFDEKANIKWGTELKEEGVKVIYGVSGLKVHSKLCYIVRREGNRMVGYAAIGTGNFNEDSASVFSDHILLTAHQGIVREVGNVFHFFDKNYKIYRFSHLLVSPFTLRNKLTRYINNEIKNAKAGKPAFIFLKVNNLVDYRIIQKLYQAQKAGVDVRLNVRGMFSLMPRFSDKIKPIPCIGLIDRFLEHSRIFIFCNNGNTKIYLSSADIMVRNLDRRVEVACPIYDKQLQKELMAMFEVQWQDTSAARILDNSLKNQMKTPGKKKKWRSQVAFYQYIKTNHE